MSGWLEARGVQHRPPMTPVFDDSSTVCDESEDDATEGQSALSITYSVFPDVKAESITRKEMRWSDIVSVLMAPKERASKEDCPLLKLATFGDNRTGKNCLRSDGNRPGHPERDPALPDGDKDLMTKLRVEAEGVLAWLVAGAVAYSQEGVEPPDEVSRMTRDYFMDQDALGRWLEQFKPCDTKDGELAGDLFDAFVTWCNDEGIDEFHPSNQTGFSLELRRRGYERRKGKDGMRYGLRTVSGSKLVTGDGL